MPLIVVDIGNTRVKWGYCAADRIVERMALPADDESAWDAQAAAWNVTSSEFVIASVQPVTRERFVRWLDAHRRSHRVIQRHEQIPIETAVDNPDHVGVDRLLDAVAANSRRGGGQRALFVDAGSAITVNLVDETGVFRGGAISPGLRLMTQSLREHTALLPAVEIHERLSPPGTTTVAAIASGVFHAAVGGIDRLLAEMNCDGAAVFITGGDAALLGPHLKTPAEIWPEMTLEGLRITACSKRK